MSRLDCGCGLLIEIDSTGVLSTIFWDNQENAELLQNMLCIRIQTNSDEQYFSLTQFLKDSNRVTGNFSIYLANRGDPLSLTTIVGNINLNERGEYEISAVQKIGVPELRSAIYGILPLQKAPLLAREENYDRPITDLHTHFSGVMTADILIQGLQKKAELNAAKNHPPNPIPYPQIYLKKVGISVTDLPGVMDRNGQPKDGLVDITPLLGRAEDLKKLKQLLHIPANKRIIFNQMEEHYVYRGIFIQDIELFKFFLEKIAEDYKRQGIEYAEISFAKVAKPNYLKIIHETLPEIEENTGVKIRFLAMLARTASKEMRQLQIQKYELISLNSPYIVGIDLLSAEVNSSYDFYPELSYLAQKYPGKIIRVHAGETSYHTENVRAVIRLAKKHPKVPFRVGHGTYGITKETILELQSCSNVTIEVNMASNIALNMHACYDSHAIDTYKEANIPVVLGSDGHGLYQSQGVDLVRFLTYRYPSSEITSFVQDLHQRERRYINYIDKMHKFDILAVLKKLMDSLSIEIEPDVELTMALSKLKSLNFDCFLGVSVIDENFDINITNQLKYMMEAYDWVIKNKRIQNYLIEKIIVGPETLAHCSAIAGEKTKLTVETNARRKNEQLHVASKIEDRFKFSPIYDSVDSGLNSISLSHTQSQGADSRTATNIVHNKTPIMITGIIPYPHHLDDRYVDKIAEVIATIRTLLDTLDCNAFYFVTTGMDIGVQKIVHKLIADYNEKHKPNKAFKLVAYVQNNVRPDQLSHYLTDIVVIEDVYSIYNIYKYFTKLTEIKGLRTICFGGSAWNSDITHIISETLRANWDTNNHIKRRQLTLVSSIDESSKRKAKELPIFEATNPLEVLAHSFDDLFSAAHEIIYDLYLQEAKKTPIEEIISMHGRVLPSTACEMANLVLLSLDSNESMEIISSEEQRDNAIALLTRCFESLFSRVCNIGDYEAIIQSTIDTSSRLTQQTKPVLMRAVLEIWQEVTARPDDPTDVERLPANRLIHSVLPMNRDPSVGCGFFKPIKAQPFDRRSHHSGAEITHSYQSRNSFLNSGTDIYNIPLGDKVAFKLSRHGASHENYTEAERTAIKAVLDEQYRKRDLKRAEELRYRTILILLDKSTLQGAAKEYSKICGHLLSYLNVIYITQVPVSIIKAHIKTTNLQDKNAIEFLTSALSASDVIKLDQNGRFEQTSVNFILDKLVQHCQGEYTLDAINAHLKSIGDDSTRIDSLYLEHVEQLISHYTKNYVENKTPLIDNNTFIVNRLLHLGIFFDNMYHFLVSKSFDYKSTINDTGSTQGFYHNGIKVLDVYWGDSRFYPEKLIDGIQIYKKYRVPGDEPWRGHENLSESDYEYLLDKRNNFIKRFSYRFIRPTERIALAQASPNDINPTAASASFEEIEGDARKSKYFIPYMNGSGPLQAALAEELGEFSLNRMGTYRFVTSSQAAHKYDIRANNETLFLRHASMFENIEQSPDKAWQGGGLIKIDLVYIEKNHIRCQYKSASRVNMEKVKDHLFGVLKKKLVQGFERPTDEQWSVELDSELRKAKKSAIRNRETHFSKIPIRSIVGWKPYPQYPEWLAIEDVTLPIISTSSAYFVSYQVPQCPINSVYFLNVEFNGIPGTNRAISTEMECHNSEAGYYYFINTLKTKFNTVEIPNAEFATKVLQAIVVNTNYVRKYLDRKSLVEINGLVDLVFVRLAHKIKCVELMTIKQLVEELHPIIDKAIAHWVNPSDSTHIYSSSISMAFYMSPKKTVNMTPQTILSEHAEARL